MESPARARRTRRQLALREAEERSLRRVCLAVARDGEPEEIFDLVAREVAELLGASGGLVVRFDRADAATVVGSHRTGDLPVPETIPLEGGTVTGLVHRTRATARVADYRAQDDPGSRLLAAMRYRGSVGAPITIGARLWGAVVAADGKPARFRASDEERLARFAEPLALAVAHAEAGERIVSDTAATIFASQLQMEPTLRAIAASARQALRAHRASCYLLSPDGTACEAVYTTEPDPAVRGRLEALAGRPAGEFPLWGMLRQERDRVLEVKDTGELPGGRAIGRGLGVGSLIGVRLEHSSVRESRGRADARGPVRELLRAAELLDPRAGGRPEPGQHGGHRRGQRAPARPDRAQPGGGAGAGDARLPDRPPQPPRLPGAACPRGGPGPVERAAAVAGALRSRSLQARQRHPRPPGGRRGAGGGGAAPVGRLPAGRRGGPDRGQEARLAAARGRRRGGLSGRRAGARGHRRDAGGDRRHGHGVRRGLRSRPGGKRRGAAAQGRRGALLGQGARARRDLRLLARGGQGALGPGARRSARADGNPQRDAGARPRDRRQGSVHAESLRAGVAHGGAARPGGGLEPSAGRPPARGGVGARRGEDRRARRDPPEADEPDARRVRPGEAPRRARGRHRRRGAVARSGRLDPPPPRALGRRAATPMGSPARRFRTAPACWPWRTRGTR